MTLASPNDVLMPALPGSDEVPARQTLYETLGSRLEELTHARTTSTARLTHAVRRRAAEATGSPKRRRSPSYPAIDLEAALDRALALYRAEGRNIAPNEAILGHWGYSQRCGPGFSTLAALKRFGLLRGEGPGKSRLSDLALRIIVDGREGSTERAAAVKQAALTPTIHQEIWETYPDGLPSDTTIRHFLVSERGFTDTAADRLIGKFRKTAAFAKLEADQPASLQSGADAVAVPIPLSATEWVTLQGRFPLSEGAWVQLMRVLDVMKPGLVAPNVEPSDDDA